MLPMQPPAPPARGGGPVGSHARRERPDSVPEVRGHRAEKLGVPAPDVDEKLLERTRSAALASIVGAEMGRGRPGNLREGAKSSSLTRGGRQNNSRPASLGDCAATGRLLER